MASEVKKEIEIQRKIAYTTGLLQGDVTVKTFIESLAEGIIVVNETGRIVLINDRWAELTGYEKQAVLGKNMNIFIPNNIHETHNSHLTEYFKNPKIRPMGMGIELYAKRKDDSTFPVEISLSFLETDAGRLSIAFITDTTLRKKAEDELKNRNIELDAYAHTVAHDLNSSISYIVNMSELLLSDDYPKEEHDKLMKSIVKKGRKMSSVIKELLIFASMRKEDVDLKVVNIKEFICNAIERLNISIKQSKAQLTLHEPLHKCIGYGPWIEEIWYNLISNAIKYGGNPPKFDIGSEITKNGYIRYFIRDYGKGIEQEKANTLFDEISIANKRSAKGYGLGLNIIKRIVDKLNGYVNVESGNGIGSTFNFYLKAPG